MTLVGPPVGPPCGQKAGNEERLSASADIGIPSVWCWWWLSTTTVRRSKSFTSDQKEGRVCAVGHSVTTNSSSRR